MPGHQVVDVESSDAVQSLQPLGHVGCHQPGLTGVEDGVAGEDHPLFRHVDSDLAWRMTGRVEQLKRVIPDAQRQVTGKDNRALVGITVILVALGKDGRAFRVIRGDGLFRIGERVEIREDHHEPVVDALVVDDLAGTLEVIVPEDVVDVMLGVDQVPDRSVRFRKRSHRDCPGRQLGGVDDHDPIRGSHEARVAASQLRVREDPRRYLFHQRRLFQHLPSFLAIGSRSSHHRWRAPGR